MTPPCLIIQLHSLLTSYRESWPPETFLSNLTHELRTPLMAISGYAEVLSDETRREFHQKALENISIYIKKLDEVITGIPEYLHELENRKSTKCLDTI